MNIKKIIQNSKSWKDLNKTLESFTKSKRSKLAGDIFEYLTKLYLETAPQYKSKLRKVYLLNEVPNNVKKKLNLPNTDEGIDLIAETFDKEYWAIQCKYRSNPNETLTVKGDLSTFNNLAFTYCKNISHAIVCATVNKPPKKIKLLKSIGFETLETWLALDDGDLFTQIKAKALGNVYKPATLKPRPHQVAAIKKTIKHFKSNERGKIIMPCGTGKSLTAFWIAKEMGVKSILIAVPSLALLQQTLKVWTREFLINGIEPEWFCVCSDNTVKDEQDDYVNDTADLGIKVDTDPSLIKQFLKKKTSKIKVVFTTYQSGRATAKGSKGFTYDLGIMDEAHKTVGSKTKEMAHLLHQKNVKIKKCISMTATERLFRGDSDEFLSMDDPKIYGDLMYELSFKEAINSKPPIISDYKIITFGITTPEIQQIYKSNKYLEVKKELKDITAREFATAIALRKAIKKLKIKNAISFHRSIRRADNFRVQQDLITKIFPSYGKLKSFHVRGDMPTSDRAIQMRNFAEGEGLMTNARCLTEGVDLPAIDCVVFTDPKRSKVDIVQAAGRALRLSKGKKFGYILIPIFIPDGADFNEAAEEQGFDDVAVTVRSLATSDTRITEYLRVISEGKKPKGGSPVDGLTSVNSLYKVEAEEFDKAIKLKLWDKVSIRNWRPFKEARDFVQKLNFKYQAEWLLYCKNKLKKFEKKPQDIPAEPKGVYKYEWKGMSDWLGTGKLPPGSMRSFEQARKFVRSLNLRNTEEWNLYCLNKLKGFKKKPTDIPISAHHTYKDEWKGMSDWLGTGKLPPGSMRSFEQARKFVRSLNLRNTEEWNLYCLNKLKGFKKKPDDIPSSASGYYKDKWKGMSDWLGNGYLSSKNKRPFEEARKYVLSLNLKGQKEWKLYCLNKLKRFKKKPDDIPTQPHISYKDKWKGTGDWLGTGRLPYGSWRSFKEARAFVQKLNLKNTNEWLLYCKNELEGFKKKPLDIPAGPHNTYKNKWKDWLDFLGTGKNYKSFKEAKRYARSLKLNYFISWKYHTRSKNFPSYIPKNPQHIYKKEWKGWPDFLGKKK